MTYDLRHDPGYVIVPRSTYQHLNDFYLSPLSGMRDLGAVLVREWGHNPEDHPALMAELEVELSGAHIETAADLMRQYGLADLRVETPAP